MKQKALLLIVLLSVGLVQSCNETDGPSIEAQEQLAIETYADIVLASYEDSYNTAEILKQKIDAFVAAPSSALFEECKTAWKNARIPYGQTEAYRFANGPLDDEDGPEGLLNAWPMDENFIDYTEGSPTSGLINDPVNYPTISKSVLEDLNESISETSIFTGYHAIEFLLWGQDFSTSGPGTRPFTDYVSGDGGTADNQQRRGQYLQALAELLLDHLASVRDEWESGGAYRAALINNANLGEVLGDIFNGIGELSKAELPTERMAVAVDTQDQENEHSCFSDNTHIDIAMNYLGIKNVYFGTYTRTDGSIVSGKSFAELARSLDATKAAEAEAAFTTADAKLNLIPTPFDQAILSSPTIVLDAVESLKDMSDRISDVALALGADQ